MKALIITISLITIGFNMVQPKPMPAPEFTDELNNIICIEEGLR